MKVLGLDVSSNYTGYAVIEDGELLFNEFVDTNNIDDIVLACDKNKKLLEEIKEEHPDIDHIVIEEALKAFTKHLSSANTIVKLSRMNATITWICYDLFDINPEFVSAKKARSSTGVEVTDEMEKELLEEGIHENKVTKMGIHNIVDENFEEYDYEMARKYPKKGTFDKADAVVVAHSKFGKL